MNSEASILWSVLFGAIGVGFFSYGRKQHAVVPLLCGLGLMVYPWFVSGTLLMVAIGAVLTAIPWFVKL